jgi:hypothetical protein
LFIIVVLLIVIGAPRSHAESNIVFDFNSLADGAGNSAIQTYMRGVIQTELGVSNGVTVTGAGAEKNYTGDNHVVGPVSGSTVTSLTLGNTDGGVQHALPWDTFIYNSNSIKIDMLFSIPIYQVSFDYEIFPNASCVNPPGSCNVFPDFRFKADGVSVLYALSLDPDAAAYTGYRHSPFSGPIDNEKSPQLLAVSSTYFFPAGVTHLEFYDWPERIGIDNLTIGVPEPATILLLGAGLAGLFAACRKKI